MVDYSYCPLSSQAGAQFVRYLRASLECKCLELSLCQALTVIIDGKGPAFQIGSTDDTSFHYPTPISTPVKKAKIGGCSFLMASRLVTASSSSGNSSRKRKAPNPAPEPLQDTFSYYLDLAAEQEVLRVAIGDTLNEDDEADDPTFDPADQYPDVDPDALPEPVSEVLLGQDQIIILDGRSESRVASNTNIGSLPLGAAAPLASTTQPTSIATINPTNDPFATDPALCVTDPNMSHFIFSLLDVLLELNHIVALTDINGPTAITLEADDGLLR